MMKRYIVKDGSESGHCCFDSTVLDTEESQFPDSPPLKHRRKLVCETFDSESAVKIADALSRGSLEKAYADVRQFHLTFGHPAPDVPTAQQWPVADRRAKWIEEECSELLNASGADGSGMGEPNLTEQADAYLDIIYFALGGLVELGVEPSRIFDLVQAANMAKVWPDGTVHKREDGKVMKPDGWQSPDPAITAEIQRQINEATE